MQIFSRVSDRVAADAGGPVVLAHAAERVLESDPKAECAFDLIRALRRLFEFAPELSTVNPCLRFLRELGRSVFHHAEKISDLFVLIVEHFSNGWFFRENDRGRSAEYVNVCCVPGK